MTNKPTLIDIAEFRSEGYLQELNRRFLHPLGLALSVQVNDDGTETLAGIWDYRDDPEGMNYHESVNTITHAQHIANLTAERMPARAKALGYWVQPPQAGQP